MHIKPINLVLSLGLAGIMLAGLGGCYYDKEEILYPGGNCDTTNVTYSGTVSGIINTNCNVCHSTASANANGGGIQLDTHPKLKVYVDNGKLMGSINHAGGYSPMPKNATKLSSCDIAKIQAWVNAGALNN
jgi:mono/diheme cytochrome c family protein